MYDAIRPASRVEKLERKLQEMEDAERRAAHHALAVRRHSSNVVNTGIGFSGMALPQPLAHGQTLHESSHHHAPVQLSPLPPPPPHSSPFEFGMLNYPPPATPFPMFPQTTSQQHQPHHPPLARSAPLPQTAGLDSMISNWPPHVSGTSSQQQQQHRQHQFTPTDSGPPSSALPGKLYSLLTSSKDATAVPSSGPGANLDHTPPPEHEDLCPGSAASSQLALTPTFGVLNPNITLGSGYPPPTASASKANGPAAPTLPEPLSDRPDDLFGSDGLGLGFGQTHSFSGDANSGFNLLNGWPGASGAGAGAGVSGSSLLMLDERDISQSARDYLCVDPWLYLDAVYSAC